MLKFKFIIINIVSYFCLVIAITDKVSSQELYFICQKPPEITDRHTIPSLEILQLSNNSIQKIWESEKNNNIKFIDLFYKDNTLIISTGLNVPSKLNVFNIHNLEFPNKIDIESYKGLFHYQLLSDKSESDFPSVPI